MVVAGQQESFPLLGFLVSVDSQNGQVDVSVEKTPRAWGAFLLVTIQGKPASWDPGFYSSQVWLSSKEMRGCLVSRKPQLYLKLSSWVVSSKGSRVWPCTQTFSASSSSLESLCWQVSLFARDLFLLTSKNTHQKTAPHFNFSVGRWVAFFNRSVLCGILSSVLKYENEMVLCFSLIALILLNRWFGGEYVYITFGKQPYMDTGNLNTCVKYSLNLKEYI